MSDLNNLFSQRNRPSPPIKRLFTDESPLNKKRSQSRSIEPHKSIRKFHQGNGQISTSLQAKDFAKRYIQKQDIKKEISHYNHQKMFFLIGGVIFFNICFNSAQVTLIMANILLLLAFVELQLGYDLLGKGYFLACKEMVKLGAYCLNFYHIFKKIGFFNESDTDYAPEILAIIGNAALNYIILTFCAPLIILERVRNNKRPYLSLFETMKAEIILFFCSIQTLYHLKRPILFMNLSYWLIVLFYIISQRSQTMLTELVTLQFLSSITLTTLLLYTFIYLISKFNEMIIIEMLSSNKKVINMNMLRLDCENRNNEMISNEMLKYIWKNCEIMWDVEFLSHNYAINYDVLEDYLNLQLQKMIEKSSKCLRNLQTASINSKNKNIVINYFHKLRKFGKEWLEIHELASFYQSKVYLFYIIEHINHFQPYSNDFPINTNILSKKITKMDDLILSIIDQVKIGELKQSMSSFYQYFHVALHPPQTQ